MKFIKWLLLTVGGNILVAGGSISEDKFWWAVVLYFIGWGVVFLTVELLTAPNTNP